MPDNEGLANASSFLFGIEPVRRLADILLLFLEARKGRPALLALLVLFLFSLFSAAVHITSRPFEADVASLLPESLAPELSPLIESKLRQKLSRTETERIAAVLTLSFESDADARAGKSEKTLADAARLWESIVLKNPVLQRAEPAGTGAIPNIPEAAGNFLTQKDKADLEKLLTLPPEAASQALAAKALRTMSGFSTGAANFSIDPFGTLDHWILERLSETPWRRTEMDGRTWLEVKSADPRERSLLLFFSAAPERVSSGKAGLARTFAQADEALKEKFATDGNVRFSSARAGVPLFTDAIASRAKDEVAWIGSVSTIGVVLFAWLLFGRISTLILMAATVGGGFLMSLGLSFAVFGKLSLITFVFGATLIGVSIDYSSHWMTMKRPGESAFDRRHRLIVPLLSAALSSAAAYLVLAFTPLPGLTQMAVLAAAGLIGALLIVLILLPFAERFAPAKDTRLMERLVIALPKIPRLSKEALRRPGVLAVLVFLAGILVFGLSKVHLASGIRDLQGAPKVLIASQLEAQKRLQLPSPAQAFVIEGETLDEAIEREKRVRILIAGTPGLEALLPQGLSLWLPTEAEQNQNRAVVRKAVQLASPVLEELLGAAPRGPGDRAIAPGDILKTSLAPVFDAFILEEPDENNGEKAVLMLTLSGVTPAHLAALKALQVPDGVHFVDITAGMDEGLSLYRDRILMLLAAGLGLLFIALTLRFGRNGWRAVLPTALGIVFSAAVLGLCGIPLTLFASLAMVLLLGLGIDYGIFITGNPSDGRTAAAVLFSGVTTMLSFGLLTFSATPALHVFGLTLFFGQLAVWVATPLLRPAQASGVKS